MGRSFARLACPLVGAVLASCWDASQRNRNLAPTASASSRRTLAGVIKSTVLPARAGVSVDGRTAMLRISFLTICATALALRFWAFGRVPSDPFYDSAVRSMGLSWHNFFYGAFDPGGTLSIDKPPIDLWLQVLSTKLFGFSSVSVRLPEAIAGALAVPLLYDVVRRGCGRAAGLSAAAALAVLPVAVMTSRSDTMDTLTGTVLLAAAWVIVATPPARRRRAVLIAAALAGIAFEIKLFQAAVAFPGLCVLAWLSLTRPAERRRALRGAGLVFLAVAAAWPVAASLLPGRHPWPIGSTNGQLWNVILVFNGLNRLGAASGATTVPLGPSPWRLFSPPYWDVLGFQLLVALAAGGVALLAWRCRWLRRGVAERPLRRAVTAGFGVWLVCGFVFFSLQGWVRMRYFEAFTPAVAAIGGIAVVWLVQGLARRRDWGSVLTGGVIVVTLAAVLAWPLSTSARVARSGTFDSQTLGALPPAQVDSLHAYLATHQRGTRYPLAASSAVVAGPLIVRDGQPIAALTSWSGQPFVSLPALRGMVARGEVRYALLDPAQNVPAVRWALAHGTDVTAAAGLSAGPRLLRLAP
jgi:4-amino-4-deoxy-L-arabinose transferase-like glycosyltransferase